MALFAAGFFLPGLLLSGCVVPSTSRVESKPAVVSDRDLMERFMRGDALPEPAFALTHPGVDVVDYERYGVFTGVGTADYRYEITDLAGLREAIGEGLFPNEDGVLDNPLYAAAYNKGVMDRSHWEAFGQDDPAVAFLLWAQAGEEPGVKAYFTAVALERAGLILPAIKAYRNVVVHFPASACWGGDGSFVWYVAPVAAASAQRLCQAYPSLGLVYEGAEVLIENGHDTDLDNDVVSVRPGRLVRRTLEERWAALPDLDVLPIVEQRGTGHVQVVRFVNGHWQLRVDGKPFMVRGVTYSPTEIGCRPENDPLFGHRWLFSDKNGNGRIDAPYDAWVDANTNGVQDPDEPAVGDFRLLQEMGCNAIRWFIPNSPSNTYDPSVVNRELLRDLTERFGIRVIAGDFIGAYTVGSGASWAEGTDYENPEQRARMKALVRAKVLDLRNEPFILMWLLGNENNMAGDHTGVNATRTNASSKPEAYARFVNELATMIHELDPDHPVAIGNLGTGMAEVYRKLAPEIDIFGINAYMGPNGFGGLWNEAHNVFDRPVLMVEYGCDAYADGVGPDEAAQAAYHRGALRDLVLNQAGSEGTGNCIGGVIFEYLDEWWKAGDDAGRQALASSWDGPMPDGKVQEEWFGLVGQGSGRNSPFERRPRQAYEMYKKKWSEGVME